MSLCPDILPSIKSHHELPCPPSISSILTTFRENNERLLRKLERTDQQRERVKKLTTKENYLKAQTTIKTDYESENKMPPRIRVNVSRLIPLDKEMLKLKLKTK